MIPNKPMDTAARNGGVGCPHISYLTQPATILIVDDTPTNLALLSSSLKDHYKVKVANNGIKALKAARSDPKPDLILLDIMMPGLSGYDVIKQLKADAITCHIPVIFLTAIVTEEDEKRGLALGAADYISKPISIPIVLARIKTQLENKAAADFLRDNNAYLESEIAKRIAEVQMIQDVTILAMASLAETRDPETGAHIRRTQYYMKVLAEKLQYHPRFAHFLSPKTIDQLFKSAPLHDIGKVGIPDAILLKPGRFTSAEFTIMQTHTTLGRNAIANAEQVLGVELEFLRIAKDIAYYHHEKWDGSGYPTGISGDIIPIPARLMALVDVYDAISSKRVYKDSVPHERVVAHIVSNKGTHFDPDIVEAFLTLEKEFLSIYERFSDADTHVKT